MTQFIAAAKAGFAAGSGCARANGKAREFQVRIPARFLKDPEISPAAKLLRVLLAAFADAQTGRTYLSLRRIEQLMGCGRIARQKAQRELAAAGWIRLERKRLGRGRWGRRVFVLGEPADPPQSNFSTVVNLDRIVISHVKSSHPFPQSF